MAVTAVAGAAAGPIPNRPNASRATWSATSPAVSDATVPPRPTGSASSRNGRRLSLPADARDTALRARSGHREVARRLDPREQVDELVGAERLLTRCVRLDDGRGDVIVLEADDEVGCAQIAAQ